MKPRFPRPKATWLLLLSHQLEWGCPLTTLRKMTMFLRESDAKMTSHWLDDQVNSRSLVSCFLRTHLIWRHLCSHTHPSPQVSSGLMGTDLVDPSGWLGGPIQSFWSYISREYTCLIINRSTYSIILAFLPFHRQCDGSNGSLTSPWLLRKGEPACMLQPSCEAWSPRRSQWLPHQLHVLSGCHGYQRRQEHCH